MITENGHGFYAWNGRLYQSDIVRAAIRPKVRAIGKAVAKHVRQDPKGTKVNPDAYMRFLLEEPNSYMSGQQLQEKLATQLELNNNAFAYIDRDENGMPIAIYPITSTSVSALLDDQNRLYLRFTLRNGKTATL
ncbi:phage portal protein, partial [Thermoactinomyces intermedius]|nr:phage portal protein [Thermoactinomyces intermedius]